MNDNPSPQDPHTRRSLIHTYLMSMWSTHIILEIGNIQDQTHATEHAPLICCVSWPFWHLGHFIDNDLECHLTVTGKYFPVIFNSQTEQLYYCYVVRHCPWTHNNNKCLLGLQQMLELVGHWSDSYMWCSVWHLTLYISSLDSDARLTKIHLIIHPHTDTLKTMARLISLSNCMDLGMLSRASV